MNTTPRSCWSGAARPFHPFGRGSFMLLSALLLALPVPTLAAPGDLDPSFDGDGLVLTDFRLGLFSGFDFVRALAVQPDGKLVAAGTFAGGVSAFALARYNPDGSLDRSFGGDGRVRPNFGGPSFAENALVLQPDGKLVAAGTGSLQAAGVVNFDFLVARFNANGSLDTTFGVGGVVRTDFDGLDDTANALVLQPDGKLVAAGGRLSGPIILARYHPDGSLDASFGAGGFVVESRGTVGNALLLQPDGKLVAADGGGLFRFNPDGTLDTSFGDGGRVGFNFAGPSAASALVLQPDGRLVAAGLSNGDFALARYHPDGNLDTSFGTSGLVLNDFGGFESASALVLQLDGKLVAAGFSRVGSTAKFALARYNLNGSIDTSFGAGGVVLTRFRGGSASAHALSLSPDGKLVAAGTSNASDDEDFALARYVTTDEPLAVPRKCGGRPATILGTSRKDTIRGTRGPDVILGLGGNDTIRGLAGNDTICGGPGLDTLIGNKGNDHLLGEGQNDRLFGDNGSDSLDGGSGRDACRTGETARRCEGQATSGERPKDPPKTPCPSVSNFPCS